MFALFLLMGIWIPDPTGPGVAWERHVHPVKVAANLTEQQCHAAGKRAISQGRSLVQAYACSEDLKA